MPRTVLDGHQFVFVGGLHRSGTTVLARALGHHSEVSAFRDTGVPADEGQHLQSVFPPAQAFGGPGHFAFHAEAHLTERSASPEDRLALEADWGPHWDINKSHLLEKSPPNLLRMRFLQALFPGSRFVLVIRHPLVVSLATQRWAGASLGHLLRHWVVAHDLCALDARSIEFLLPVSYEQLTLDPAATLRSIWRWLGLDVPRHVETASFRSTNNKYFKRWEESNNGSIRRVSTEILVRRFEPSLRRYGYSLRDLTLAPLSGISAIPHSP